MNNLRIPPPVQGLFWAGCMWGITKVIPSATLSFPFQSLFALLFLIIGLAIEGSSVLAFFKAHTSLNPIHLEKASKLVTDGFYRVSRNPMYLGMGFLLTAWLFYLGNPINILALMGFVLVMNKIQIKPEEAVLLAKFGNDYQTYQTRTRRWI